MTVLKEKRQITSGKIKRGFKRYNNMFNRNNIGLTL